MRRLFFAASAAVVAIGLPAQNASAVEEPQHRPRVCLVLSGGGALGIAHIGVLKVLEELRVPVDCVVGTSMGAIIGGLYAAGYSPQELERLTTSLPWHEILADRPDRRRLPFRRKVDDLTYLTRWELGYSDGRLRMPAGVIAGQNLGVELRVLGLRAAGITDFDRLPLPFRAVATDLGTGEMVALDHGDLATALRASMAVPGVFAPVEVDGRTLIDGGIVANLPVGVARSMGADVVIAVDLGQPLTSERPPDTIAGIVQRTTQFLTRLNVQRELAGVDILIRPDVRQWGLLDFRAASEILPRGSEAANASAAALRRLAVTPGEWEAFLRTQRRRTPTLHVATVVVDPGLRLYADEVIGQIRTRPGRDLDVPTLRNDLLRVWELGEFVTADFTLLPQGDAWVLTLVAHPKPWGPNFLRFGLSASSDLEGTSQFNALAAFTMTNLNRGGAELKAAAQIGQDPIGQVELYQPVGGSRVPFVSAAAYTSVHKAQIPINSAVEQYRFSIVRGSLDVGLALGRYGELRLGIRRDQTAGRATTHDSGHPPRYDQSDAGVRFNVLIDQLDSVNFPHKGCLAVAEVFSSSSSLGADERYRRLDLSLVGAATLRRHTLIGLVHGSSALGGTLPAAERVQLGGLFNLSGLPPGEVTGSYGGVAALIYLYRLGRLSTLGEGIYLGTSLEAGNAWETPQQASLSDLRYSWTLMFGADTILGPLYLGHGVTSGGKDSFYLLLGRTF
ncbi:MAG: patatin-like phospholipase family protein [Acidobacteriota bacterium]